MARIPTVQRRQGLDTAAGTIPNTRVDTSIGEALSGAGANLSAIGERMAQREHQRNEFLTQQGFQQLGSQVESDMQGLQREMDPTGQGFHDRAMETFKTRAQEFLSTLPEDMRDEWSERVQTLQMDLSNKAAQVELGQWDVYQTTETTKMLDQLATGINQYGSGSLEAYVAQGEEIINATNLPPVKKEELLTQWRETAQTTALMTMPPEERKRALGDALGINIPQATASVVDRIIGVESGGSNTAKNPNSSATGAGQFIDSTWVNMIRKHRPDLAEGKSRKQILAMRTNGDLSREMVARYAEENAAALQAAGFQPTAGNIYLAHFLGPQGAIDMLRADPNADAASVNPSAARSNKTIFYRRDNPKSVAQILAWADEKMGGDRSAPDIRRPLSDPDPRFADVPLDTRMRLIEAADNEIMASLKQRQAQQTAMLAELKGNFQLGIATDNPEITETAILQSPLADDDKAQLINSLNSKRAGAQRTAAAMQSFLEGSLRVDPYSSDGRKTVDDLFNEVAKSTEPEQLQATAEDIVRQTGVVPQVALNAIRGGLTSQDVNEVMAAAQSAQRLSSVDPAALARRDGGAEVQRAADDFSHYVNDLNLSPEQAARRIMEARDPAKQRDRKALEPLVTEFKKEMEEVDLSAVFDDSILGWRSNPDLGFSPAQEAGIKAEFIAIAEDEFYRANGDAEIAQKRAKETMKRLYGVTEITGRRVVMKHPPERYWPSANESLDYARQQLEADLQQFDENVDMSTVQIVTTPATDRMIKAGELPGYAILYKDANGVIQTIPGQLWRPDTDPARRASELQQLIDETEAAEEQAAREDRARRSQQRAMDTIEARDRERSLDSFIDGPVLPEAAGGE